MEEKKSLQEAQRIMDDFSVRTGLIGDKGDSSRRYLWTDAFAVQTLFGLGRVNNEQAYVDRAVKLIDMVHDKLGHFHPDDEREGWIVGLAEEAGWDHPTAGGLRIGKKLPERKASEPYNESLEWERDGQYFHYLTRWVNALLKAGQQTGVKKYEHWAAELLVAAHKFVDKSRGRLRMYWKMSVDLSRPLIDNQGAHDPLEGLICAESVMKAAPEKAEELWSFSEDMRQLCRGQDWYTTDDLGIGSLLLNAIRTLDLEQEKLPEEVQPVHLFTNILEGLESHAQSYNKNRSASQRLAFRECGLSLGLRAMEGLDVIPPEIKDLYKQLELYFPLANEIEDFWRNPQNLQSSTWSGHLDINEVSLASSLTAKSFSQAY